MSEVSNETVEVINPASGLPFDFSKFSSDAMLSRRGNVRPLLTKKNRGGDGGTTHYKPRLPCVNPRPPVKDTEEFNALRETGRVSGNERLLDGSYWLNW